MFSMTGYGKGEYREGGIELTVEIKTVNNRYLDVSFKSPKIFIACEEPVRQRVREQLTRGHADIFVNFVDKREKPKTLYVDENAARGWAAAAAKVKALFPNLTDDFTLSAMMKCADVVRSEEVTEEDDTLPSALFSALSAALEKLNTMRAKEGEKLAADMLSRMAMSIKRVSPAPSDIESSSGRFLLTPMRRDISEILSMPTSCARRTVIRLRDFSIPSRSVINP